MQTTDAPESKGKVWPPAPTVEPTGPVAAPAVDPGRRPAITWLALPYALTVVILAAGWLPPTGWWVLLSLLIAPIAAGSVLSRVQRVTKMGVLAQMGHYIGLGVLIAVPCAFVLGIEGKYGLGPIHLTLASMSGVLLAVMALIAMGIGFESMAVFLFRRSDDPLRTGESGDEESNAER